MLCCHLLPSMLPFRMECCVLGASLATIFSRNIQLLKNYPSALHLFGFDSNYSLNIQKAETTTQLLVQLWKKKLIACSFSWVPVNFDRQEWEWTSDVRALGEFSFGTLWASIQGSGSYSMQLLLNHAARASCNKILSSVVGTGILSWPPRSAWQNGQN